MVGIEIESQYSHTASIPPMNARETVLTAVPGATDTARLQLVLVQTGAAGSHVELREQTWADGVGWYTQSSVRIGTDQVAELRNALGMSGPAAKLRAEGKAPPQTASTASGPARHQLRIVG